MMLGEYSSSHSRRKLASWGGIRKRHSTWLRDDRRIIVAVLVAKECIRASRVIIIIGLQAVGEETQILTTGIGGRFLHV